MGKGDGRRPTLVPDARFGASWCHSVGHKMRGDSEWCINCGLSGLQIEEQRLCTHGRQVTPEGEYGVTYCLDCGMRGELEHGRDVRAVSVQER